LLLTKAGLAPATLEQIEHFKLMRQFSEDPHGFVQDALQEAP
jgi:predicted ATPase